jgi:thiol-disulfide isomerase/thioredoxin
MKRRTVFAALGVLFLCAGLARAQHEYAPVEEKVVNYKNWTLPGLSDRKLVNLRAWAQGKKLVLVVYFAPWCGNWRYNFPVVSRLYEKYKAQGLGVVGISEYGSLDETRNYFGPSGPPFPIVVESETRDDRALTAHYGYRQLTGDKRNWGSPWHIFLEPAKLNPQGDLLADKAFVVNGELIEEEADKFIAARLAAPVSAPKAEGKSLFSVGQDAAKPAFNVKTTLGGPQPKKDDAPKPCTDKP